MGGTSIFVKDKNTLQFDVARFLMHANYSPTTMRNDIGLLYLKKQVSSAAKTVQPIALNTKPVLSATKCRVTGWGRMDNDAVSIDSNLCVGPDNNRSIFPFSERTFCLAHGSNCAHCW